MVSRVVGDDGTGDIGYAEAPASTDREKFSLRGQRPARPLSDCETVTLPIDPKATRVEQVVRLSRPRSTDKGSLRGTAAGSAAERLRDGDVTNRPQSQPSGTGGAAEPAAVHR